MKEETKEDHRMSQHHYRRITQIGLISLFVIGLASCRKAPDNVDVGVLLPPYVHIEYEVHNGYNDTGIYIRRAGQTYVKHERGTGGVAEFFGFEGTNVGYDDGQGDIQDYITFRLFGTEWVRASNWNDNINYYTLMGSGSWSPYQSGTVYGPFYYLTQGVGALNNQSVTYIKQADESLSILGGVFSCLVFTLQENYTTANGQLTATTKIWLEKDTLLLFKKSYITSASDDINSESAIEFKVTKFYTGTSINFPSGVPQSAN